MLSLLLASSGRRAVRTPTLATASSIAVATPSFALAAAPLAVRAASFSSFSLAATTQRNDALRLQQPLPLLHHAAKRHLATSTVGQIPQVCAVLGAQWGDEGKGKLVDILAKRYDIIARFNGGANAGHTLVVDGKKFAFHLLPCGMLYDNKINVVGNGVVVHVPTLLKELKSLQDNGVSYAGKLKISDRAHLLFDFHQTVDSMQEKALEGSEIGTTKKGIGPCYGSKANRDGMRVGDLRHPAYFEKNFTRLANNMMKKFNITVDIKSELERYREYASILDGMIVDSVQLLHQSLRDGKTLLAEGANAALLDLDFGSYPFVTSSSTSGGGVCTGLGIPPSKVGAVYGVAKAYTTRVGAGPFPTELTDDIGAKIRAVGREFGTTTGRPRRCGWLDIPVIQYSNLLNNYEAINITKLDVLSDLPEIKIGVAYKLDGKRLPYGAMPSHLEALSRVEVEYETMKGWQSDISQCRKFSDLPAEAQTFINRVSQLVGVKVTWVGVGPGRFDMTGDL